MKLKPPIVTLLAGAVLAAAILAANLVSSPGDDAAGASVTSPAPSSAPPSTPSAVAPSTQPPASTPAAAVTTAPPQLVTATWAGHVDGGGASVAIVARKGVAIAYVCDGGRIEAWLTGTASDGRLTLKGKRGASLRGTFGNGLATGTVRTGSRTWTFEVAVAKKPSGLCRSTSRVRGATVDAGWIVLADGSQVGAFTTDGEKPQSAPRLDTAAGTATVNGTTIRATAIDPDSGAGF